VRRTFLLAGLLCLLAARPVPLLARLQIGRLPGDLGIEGKGFQVCLPLARSLIARRIVSLLVCLFRSGDRASGASCEGLPEVGDEVLGVLDADG
jgi:hypothetical protein